AYVLGMRRIGWRGIVRYVDAANAEKDFYGATMGILEAIARKTLSLSTLALGVTFTATAEASSSNISSIFSPQSTPAKSIFDLSVFVLIITGIIFAVVFTLLVYSITKFRAKPDNASREPAQVYGSTQIELAWTIIPILIVVVLFLASARVIHAVQ